MDAVIFTADAELQERLNLLPLFDALTDEPIACGPYIERRIADAKAWRARWAEPERNRPADEPLDRQATTLFWLDTLISDLESIQLRYRLEHPQNAT